jgi:TatA/E family protein of Tat protein translocase
MGLSITHILLLALIVLIFFGPSRLPSLGRSLGEAIRGFKKGIEGLDETTRDVTATPPTENLNKNTTEQKT